ncbi:MAG: SRPBCC family protein [Methylophilaceae bacterium]
MKKFLFLLVTLLASFQIYAHGPTPQKVQETITINASVEKVWAVVKDFCNIQKWHPAVEKTTCEKKGGDTFRTLVISSGETVYEKLRSVDEDLLKLKFEIVESPNPFTDFNSYLIVTKGANDNEASVQWTARFYRLYKLNPPIPEGQDDATAKAAAQAIVDSGLAGLKKMLEAK